LWFAKRRWAGVPYSVRIVPYKNPRFSADLETKAPSGKAFSVKKLKNTGTTSCLYTKHEAVPAFFSLVTKKASFLFNTNSIKI
jgi:hypothetical protein